MKTLSIVATSRNDDHGGNLLHRMQLFVNGVIAQCNRHDLDAELILVEWNPPADRPRLSEALRWPSGTGRCTVRIVEVPEAIHSRFRHSDRLPLFQMIAKNVGIRRARGRFILATNIDILFSDELMRSIRLGRLKPGFVYRIDRFDVYGDIPPDMTMDGLLTYCRWHVLRIHGRYCSRNLVTGEDRWAQHPLTPLPYLVFLLHNLRYQRRLKENVMLWAIRYLRSFVKVWIRLMKSGNYPRLHMNACGDFTLTDAASWQAVRGYWEWEGFSMHLDSHLLHALYLAGVREKVLKDPLRIYHIEHDIGSGYTPEGQELLYERIARAGIPMLDMKLMLGRAFRASREGKRLIYNTEDWGLASEELPETRIGA